LALIGSVVLLISNTVAIVGAYYKFGGRLQTLEAKCHIIEKEFIPSMLSQLEQKNSMEARNRQLECSIITAKQIEAMKDEIRELRKIMEEHLAVSAERYKQQTSNNKQRTTK
jgi:hypothetical protein